MEQTTTRLNLSKGEVINLAKEGTKLDRICAAAGWDIADTTTSNHSFDLDLSVFMLENGKLLSNSDIVYFGRKEATGIRHHGDNLTGAGDGDDETISLDLNALETRITDCVFVLNIFEATQRGQKFSDVKNAFIRIYNQDNTEEICRFELNGNSHTTNALIFGSVHRNEGTGNWTFKAREEAFNGDLNALAEHFRN